MSAPEGNANWGGTSMGITKTCKDKRLAWEFLKFATLSTEGARTLNSMGLMTTAKKPYEEDPSLKSYKSRWSEIRIWASIIWIISYQALKHVHLPRRMV